MFLVMALYLFQFSTVDGRNPEPPPGMYKTLKIMGLTTNLNWSRISSINSIFQMAVKNFPTQKKMVVHKKNKKMVISGGITGIMSLCAT